MTQKTEQEAKSIGARFRSARSLVPHLNRKSFCERYEINRYTMQSWENGLHVCKGKNVEKFIQALAKEGIACSAEWLIDGIGEPAQPFLALGENTSKPAHTLDLRSLHTLVPHYISDHAMEPQFRAGDHVLGVDISSDPKRAHQKYVIVKLSEERQVVRKALFFKDHLILVANDCRIATFSLRLPTTIYQIIWHRIN
jgi:hypothetical protein